MAYPTAVNDQITDAVTQGSIAVLGSVSPVAHGALQQAAAHAAATAIQNAVTAQQQLATVGQAALTAAVSALIDLSRGASHVAHDTPTHTQQQGVF